MISVDNLWSRLLTAFSGCSRDGSKCKFKFSLNQFNLDLNLAVVEMVQSVLKNRDKSNVLQRSKATKQ